MAKSTAGRLNKRATVTIVDVAALAGVAVSTASRALSATTTHKISAEATRKIEAAARQLGYQRNSIASSLRTRRSDTIGVIVPNLADPLFAAIIAAIEDRVSEDGFTTFVANSNYSQKKLSSIIEKMASQNVAGMVVASFELEDPSIQLCVERCIPTVAVLRDPGQGLISSVTMDDTRGVEALVAHLLEFGHRDITYITPAIVASTAKNRLDGFNSIASRRAQPGYSFTVVEARAYDVAEGERMMASLLSDRTSSTAFIGFNDLLAVGCLKTLKAFGISCPEDVSVAGINDLPFMDMLSPALTTLRTAGRELGSEGAEILMGLLKKTDRPQKRILFPSQLMVRGTTGPVRRQE